MDDDAKKREPGCDCHQEEGDSPCQVHGLEDGADVAHLVSEVDRLKAELKMTAIRASEYDKIVAIFDPLPGEDLPARLARLRDTRKQALLESAAVLDAMAHCDHVRPHLPPARALADMDKQIAALKAKVAELEEALATNEVERQAQIKERKRAEARVRAWEMATGETKPRIVKARMEERDAVVAKLGEAIELAEARRPPWVTWGDLPAQQETQLAALKAYHASLTQELPHDLPAPGRDRPLRVYVAGGSSERLLVQGWIGELVRHGIEVTCDWTRDPGWNLGRMPTTEELAEAATRDLAGIDAADLVWRIVPVKLSEGSADEGGYARGRGKRIVVSGAIGSRNVFELLPNVARFATHEEAAAHIVGIARPYQCTPCLTWQEPEYGGRCRACGGSKEEHEGRRQ